MYRSKQQARGKSNPEITKNPSMTIEGEYMEMKDIMRIAKNGGQIPQTDVQYFRPDEIQHINSLYKNSMDLTDIDRLRERNREMKSTLEKAFQRKREKQDELNKELKENPDVEIKENPDGKITEK